MNKLVVIVEGETEQTFVRDQLAAHLVMYGTTTWAVLPGRRQNRRGVRKWEGASRDIVRALKGGHYCSTMVDYYALPADWPGSVESAAMPWEQRASLIEAKVSEEIEKIMGGSFNPKFFIPYVQLHEFEALTFASVEKLASVAAPLSTYSSDNLQQRFQDVLEEAGHPEAINDGYETCPSRRITKVAKRYRKRVHSPIVTSRIGLKTLRDKCDHFASWLDRLERIGVDKP